VLFFASTGTGTMEAALVNVLAPGDSILISTHGWFGECFVAIAQSLSARCAPDPVQIAASVRARDYRAVVIVQNEISTGVVADLAAIGAILRDLPTLLIVDSVSGLDGVENN
jgi:aspartate aminotransferase-like enzyme